MCNQLRYAQLFYAHMTVLEVEAMAFNSSVIVTCNLSKAQLACFLEPSSLTIHHRSDTACRPLADRGRGLHCIMIEIFPIKLHHEKYHVRTVSSIVACKYGRVINLCLKLTSSVHLCIEISTVKQQW